MNKTPKAIVIGATSGIGMEVAKCLANKGWQVGIAGRRTERLAALQQQVAGITCYKQIDITDNQAATQLYDLIEQTGGMDLYFHSSGIGWQNTQLDLDKELNTTLTNGVGFVRMIDAAFQWFATHQHAGRIACISSIAGTKVLGAAPAYSSTKRFQIHYMECLSQLAHMHHLPISFTDIRPGFVATDLIAGSHFPLQLDAKKVAHNIVKAIEQGKGIKIIDWRYWLLTKLWQLIPRSIWTRLPIQ